MDGQSENAYLILKCHFVHADFKNPSVNKLGEITRFPLSPGIILRAIKNIHLRL